MVDLELESASWCDLDFNHWYIRWVTDQVHEFLYTYDAKLNVVPQLADGMPRQIDRFTTEVKIKKGIRFHNGDLLTAEHVAATFNTARDRGVWKRPLDRLGSVTVVNPTTLQFTLIRPFALLLNKMTVVPILHKDFLTVKDKAMGTGPFMWGDYQPGSYVRLKANPAYRRGAPGIAEVIFRFVPTLGAQLVNITRGDAHIIIPPFSAIEALSKDPNLTVYKYPSTVNILWWNSAIAFPDYRVRQALAYAMDRKTVLDVVFHDYGTIGQGPINPVAEGYPYTKKYYSPRPNLAKAKALLAASGAKLPITFDFVAPNDDNLKSVGQILQQSWAKVGLNANLVFLELGAWNARFVTGKWGVCCLYSLTGPSSGTGADTATGSMESGAANNYAKFRNRQMDSLLNQAKATANPSVRARVYGRIGNLAAEKAMITPPVYPQFVLAVRKSVKGLNTSALRITRLDLTKVSLK